MKNLLLAPAIAVALSGFVAVPALATGTVGEFVSSTGSALQSSTASATSQPAPRATSDPNVLVSAEVTPADLTNKEVGVTVLISNAEPGSSATDSLSNDSDVIDETGTLVWTITSTSTIAAGTEVPFTITYTPAGGEPTTVDSSFTVVDAYSTDEGDDSEPAPTDSPEPTATPDPTPSDENDDDATVEYALSINPVEITPANFVNDKKGVELSVDGLAPGETVEYSVSPSGSNVTPLTKDAVANENGTAVWTGHGINDADPSAYLGRYDVTVTNEAGDKLTGAFTVTNTPDDDGNAGGDEDTNGNDQPNDDKKNDDGNKDDEGSGDGGSDLPRTGAELGGLAAGAALLTVGAATVLLTRRRAAKA